MPASARTRTIKRKLQILILLTSSIALLSSCLAFFANEFWELRNRKVEDLSTLAEVVSENTAAALTFDDPDASTDTLNAFRVRPSIISAWVCDSNHALFATYGATPITNKDCQGNAPL